MITLEFSQNGYVHREWHFDFKHYKKIEALVRILNVRCLGRGGWYLKTSGFIGTIPNRLPVQNVSYLYFRYLMHDRPSRHYQYMRTVEFS